MERLSSPTRSLLGRVRDPDLVERVRLTSALGGIDQAIDRARQAETALRERLGDPEQIRAELDGLDRAITQLEHERNGILDQLTDRELQAPSEWARELLGERPAGSRGQAWDDALRRVARYRLDHAITDTPDPLGPQPADERQPGSGNAPTMPSSAASTASTPTTTTSTSGAEMADPKLLTVPQVAAEFQVTAQTIRNWIDHGTLPAVRVGRAFRVKREDVDALLERASADSGSLATRRALWEPSTTTLPRRPGPGRRARCGTTPATPSCRARSRSSEKTDDAARTRRGPPLRGLTRAGPNQESATPILALDGFRKIGRRVRKCVVGLGHSEQLGSSRHAIELRDRTVEGAP